MTARLVTLALLLTIPVLSSGQSLCRYRLNVSVAYDSDVASATILESRFRAEVEGEKVDLKVRATDPDSGHVVLVLDTSGSMLSATAKWLLARTMAAEFVGTRGPEPLAAITFSNDIETRITFAEGPSAVRRLLDALPSERKGFGKGQRMTALHNALLEAAHMLPESGLNNVVYVITDGGDNRSRAKYRDLERLYLSRNIRLFAVILRSAFSDESPREVGQLATLTGGGMIHQLPRDLRPLDPYNEDFRMSTEERQDLTDDLRELYRQMRSPYTLELEILGPRHKPQKLRLELVDEKGKRIKNTHIAYPRKVPPCNDSGAVKN